MPLICGVPINDGISLVRKIFFSSPDLDLMVIGYLEDGSSISINAMWESPFENDSIGSIQGIQKAANVAQARFNTTSVSLLNSLLTWNGQKPPDLNLVVHFRAVTNPALEVMKPLASLYQMQAPELNRALAGGRRPHVIHINIGQRILLVDCVFMTITHDLSAPKDSAGNFLYQTVSINASAMSVKNVSDFPSIYV